MGGVEGYCGAEKCDAAHEETSLPEGCGPALVRAAVVCLGASGELGIPFSVPVTWVFLSFLAGVFFAPGFEVLFLLRLQLSCWISRKLNAVGLTSPHSAKEEERESGLGGTPPTERQTSERPSVPLSPERTTAGYSAPRP